MENYYLQWVCMEIKRVKLRAHSHSRSLNRAFLHEVEIFRYNLIRSVYLHGTSEVGLLLKQTLQVRIVFKCKEKCNKTPKTDG